MPDTASRPKSRRAFWAVAAFYALVAFEVAYMASPFALYFYTVYAPGLGFISNNAALSWLSFFFLPHIVVDTSSTLVNLRTPVGVALFVGGFVAFCACAAQLYFSKLRRRGAVTTRAYGTVRHPQYVSLAVSSFGLLILWPRYLALLLFLAMVFAYYLLARTEECECARRFGQRYVDYKVRTNMFLPFRVPMPDVLRGLEDSAPKRYLAWGALFVIASVLSLGVAREVRHFSVESLHTHYAEDAAYISVASIAPATLEAIVKAVASDVGVTTRLNAAGVDENTRFVNYVLPDGWFVSEIPMKSFPGAGGHHSPPPSDANRYRIVFARATLRRKDVGGTADLILNTIHTTPVMEVSFDLARPVIQFEEPLETRRYDGVPVPIF